MAKALALDPDQVRYFRARRGGLAAPLASPAAVARANVGMQSQQLPPSLWGLAQRSAGTPSADALQAELFGRQRSLVRTWGSRGKVVATWTHKLRAKRVDVTVTPLSGWRKTKHLTGVKKAAQAYAEHLGRAELQVLGV